MQLLTAQLRALLPPLGAQEARGADAIAHCKFFTPDGAWSWYATEYDGDDTFFGLVDGHEKELGYFSLAELQGSRGPMGLAIERDLYWRPRTLRQIAPDVFADWPAGAGQ